MEEISENIEPVEDSRDDYEAPALRDLGNLIDLTETTPPLPGANGPYS